MTLSKFIRQSTLTATALTSLLTAMPAWAQGAWDEDEGRCVTTVEMGEGENAVIKEVATFRGIECLLANVLNVAVTFVGLAAFVMVIYGAFLYLTSGGSSKGTEAGKQALTYAIIGIVVALMAFWILNLIATFTGVSGILNFSLSLD